MKQIILTNPFDAHAHFRQKEILQNILPYTMHQFSGALAMPNTTPALTSLYLLQEYIDEVMKIVDQKSFLPIFTFYLSPDLRIEDLKIAWDLQLFNGIKYYPKGGTTNSDGGSLGFEKVKDILSLMEHEGIPLLIHGETPEIDGDVVDDFEREAVFYENEMSLLVKAFPNLKIVLEHITTKEAVSFAKHHKNVRATITPQHLLFDRRSLFNHSVALDNSCITNTQKNGMMPDFMCRPILKHQKHVTALRDALIWQATNNKKIFGLGTDTAYHDKNKKYCECGACGVFTAPIALELYAMAFEQMGILDHLPVFACEIMPEFYDIKNILPKKTVILTKKTQQVESVYYNGTVPFAGQIIPWSAKIV